MAETINLFLSASHATVSFVFSVWRQSFPLSASSVSDVSYFLCPSATSLSDVSRFLCLLLLQATSVVSSFYLLLMCLKAAVSFVCSPSKVSCFLCLSASSTASLAWWLRRPPRERKIPGSNPACHGIFFGVESFQWLQNWHSSGYPARRLAL